MMKPGSLIVVGPGIALAAQCTPQARGAIEAADVVFALLGDPIAQHWLEGLNSNVVSLQYFYKGATDRLWAYEAMVETILSAVREGKDVCAVFYGHPGVFVTPSHKAVSQARAEGFAARMLPGISAEDCLFADLGVDPAAYGCQSYEARDFILNARIFDPRASLILWQIAVLGDDTFKAFKAERRWIEALARVLMQHYPDSHIVTVYEAAVLPTLQPKVLQGPLCDLGKVAVTQVSTLYVPPLGARDFSRERLALLHAC